MKYMKRFTTTEELTAFVSFHRNETGLRFQAEPEANEAWIEVEEKIYRELQHADGVVD